MLRFSVGRGVLKSAFTSTSTPARYIATTRVANMEEHRNMFEPNGLLKKGSYSLQVGAPNPNTLKKVSNFYNEALERIRQSERFEETFQYGVMGGADSVRNEVAKFLTRQYAQSVHKEDVFITSGASEGLIFLLNTFFTSEHTLFVEDPTYLLVPNFVKKGYVCKGEPVSVLEDGLDLDELEAKVQRLPELPVTSASPYRAAVYTITTFHNPTGISYSPAKCKKLVELARKYNLLVIADDVYNVLTYQSETNDINFDPPPTRLFAYDDKNHPDYQGNVVANGSFAKIVAPGLRLGWYEAPKRILDELRTNYVLLSGGGMSSSGSYILAEALRNGDIDKHVQELRILHRSRMNAVTDVVDSELGKYGVTITHPAGGYFLWVKLPENIAAESVLKYAAENVHVTFVPGRAASLSGQYGNYIRLSIAYYETDEITEAAKKFSQAVKTVIEQTNNE